MVVIFYVHKNFSQFANHILATNHYFNINKVLEKSHKNTMGIQIDNL